MVNLACEETVTTKRYFLVCRLAALLCAIAATGFLSRCSAQERLSLDQAVARALASRASLKAEAQRIPAAQGLLAQARLLPNPSVQFENQNLGPTQSYVRDVDTYAY